jgi:hypothetical protein
MFRIVLFSREFAMVFRGTTQSYFITFQTDYSGTKLHKVLAVNVEF